MRAHFIACQQINVGLSP